MYKIVLALSLFCSLSLFAETADLNGAFSPSSQKWFAKEDKILSPEQLPWKKGVLLSCKNGEEILLQENKTPLLANCISFVHTMEPGKEIDYWRAATALALRKLDVPPALPVVMTYEITYADGQTLSVPVRYGEGIEEWYRLHDIAPMLWANVAWSRDLDAVTGEKAALYRMQWPNPRPEVPVTRITAKGNGDYGTLLLLDIQFDTTPVDGKSFYVASTPQGNDSNAGTFEAPLRTVQEAVQRAKPGDCVYLRGGYYALDTPVELFYTGEKGKWLTVSAYPGEDPVLDGRGVALARYENVSDWKGGPFYWDMGLFSVLGDPSYIRIQGLHIHNARRAGISVYGKITTGADGKKIWGPGQCVETLFNTTYRCYAMGIIVQGIDSLKVIGNQIIRPHSQTITNAGETSEKFAVTELAQEAIDLTENRCFEIAYNVIAGGGKEAIDCINIEDGNIHHNYIDGCLNGIYIDSWSKPIRNLDIHHNYIVNAYNGIPLSTEGSGSLFDIDIHHNIVTESKSVGISIAEATYKSKPAEVMRHRIRHNTIHKSGGHAREIGWAQYGIELNGFPDNPDFRQIDVCDNIVSSGVSRAVYAVFPDLRERKIRIFNNLLDSTENRMAAKNYTVDNVGYTDAGRGDFTLLPSSPAIGKATGKGDIGALPFGSKWNVGRDWSGKITAFYHGEVEWESIDIPRSLYNLYRNHLQRPSWFQKARYGVDLQNLPSGMQSLAGTTYYIENEEQTGLPSAIALKSWGVEVEQEKIEGIPVNRKAGKLSFLHTYRMAEDVITGKSFNPQPIEKGTPLFAYIIHYEDGTQVEIPVRWQTDIDNWYRQLESPSDAPLAWQIKVASRKEPTEAVCLYACTWDNPFPQKAIRSVDMVNKQPGTVGTPALFAISAGDKIEK